MTQERATKLRVAMTDAFPEARVTDYAGLIAAMPNDPNDRHVAAAAVKSGRPGHCHDESSRLCTAP
jgi:hypothetical protein